MKDTCTKWRFLVPGLLFLVVSVVKFSQNSNRESNQKLETRDEKLNNTCAIWICRDMAELSEVHFWQEVGSELKEG